LKPDGVLFSNGPGDPRCASFADPLSVSLVHANVHVIK